MGAECDLNLRPVLRKQRTPYKQVDNRRNFATAGQNGSSTLLVLRPRQRANLCDTDETRLASKGPRGRIATLTFSEYYVTSTSDKSPGKRERATAANQLRNGQPTSDEATRQVNTDNMYAKVVVKEGIVQALLDSGADVSCVNANITDTNNQEKIACTACVLHAGAHRTEVGVRGDDVFRGLGRQERKILISMQLSPDYHAREAIKGR
ncbi:hypothetical protein EVAR_85537_1 [Eumeta japonica]|uniref:Uncharacterized protein n=1 Tax=Eumeta variegata TaxID=151549 RepID=A0A4C1VAW8_EUMVA|nr:hypothetical protein EVAR_85537_1 [Eumeta japonica]